MLVTCVTWKPIPAPSKITLDVWQELDKLKMSKLYNNFVLGGSYLVGKTVCVVVVFHIHIEAMKGFWLLGA